MRAARKGRPGRPARPVPRTPATRCWGRESPYVVKVGAGAGARWGKPGRRASRHSGSLWRPGGAHFFAASSFGRGPSSANAPIAHPVGEGLNSATLTVLVSPGSAPLACLCHRALPCVGQYPSRHGPLSLGTVHQVCLGYTLEELLGSPCVRKRQVVSLLLLCLPQAAG